MDHAACRFSLLSRPQTPFQESLELWMFCGIEHERIDSVTYNSHAPDQYRTARTELLSRNGLTDKDIG